VAGVSRRQRAAKGKNRGTVGLTVDDKRWSARGMQWTPGNALSRWGLDRCPVAVSHGCACTVPVGFGEEIPWLGLGRELARGPM
jgi:hypothetical protein